VTEDTTPASRSISLDSLLILLQEGTLTVEGLLPEGSNYTFLTTVSRGEQETYAVYKPTRGEQPLWDFPESTLALREVAAFVVSEALGWHFVPPTVYRHDGPHGPGSLQYFVQAQDDCHYFTLSPEEKRKLPRVAVFDLLVNNADRKGGHILKDTTGKLWLIDHGICFNTQNKLRTVVWDYSGQSIPEALLQDVGALRQKLEPGQDLAESLSSLLSDDEVAAMRRRADRLLANRKFPQPGPGRNYPWPPL
jgi:uncharacterized repeat protein (TIGR03843 family)